jgi:hypothetical protein
MDARGSVKSGVVRIAGPLGRRAEDRGYCPLSGALALLWPWDEPPAWPVAEPIDPHRELPRSLGRTWERPPDSESVALLYARLPALELVDNPQEMYARGNE